MNQISSISKIDKEFNEKVYKLVERKQDNIENLVEKSVAFVPWLLFKIYAELESETNLDKFCICINYASRLFPNKRFHIHTKKGEVKTFCWQDNRQQDFNFNDISINYNLESPFVGLLDIFYRINEIKSEGKDNFSMNKYLETRIGINQQDTVCLDESKYNSDDVMQYLKNNFVVPDVNYNRYAAYLWIATGNIQGNPLLQKDPTPDTDQLLLEVLELMASNKDVFPKWTNFKKKGNYFQYNIPILGFDNDTVKVICNIVVPSLIDFSEEMQQAFRMLSNLWINRIWDYENNAWANANAVRASIAQVMARNLSHNYGSHVLNHLLQPTLESFIFKKNPYLCKYKPKNSDAAKETYEQALYLLNELKGSLNDLTDIQKEAAIILPEKVGELINAVLEAKDVHSESLRQVTFLLNHIKCRVDYISDISFGAPMLQTTRNVYNDIFMELDRVSLLMNHISGLEENFNYEIKIKGPDGELNGQKDLPVAIPNDVVGTHAFYNILENIIRNTAKHSKNGNDTVIFQIDFSNITTGNMPERLKDEAQKYYCVEIYDNIAMNKNYAENLVNEQNKRLNEPIFEGKRPRSHSLGLVEMESSATYLRKLDTGVIDDERYHVINKMEDSELYKKYKDCYYNQYDHFNLLKAIMKPAKETGKYYFGYRFFMLRPQEVLIVGDDKTLQNLHKPQEGVWYIDKEDFQKDLGNGKVFNHEFVVYFDDEILTTINEHKTSLSPRVLKMTGEEVYNKTSFRIKLKCWKKWGESNFIRNERKWTIDNVYCGVTDPPENAAVYLRHIENPKSDEKFCKYSYVEALSSLATGKLPGIGNDELSNYPSKLNGLNGKTMFYYQNMESVNNKILVVDERIQDAATHHIVYKHRLDEHYKKMDVTVPEMPEHENEKGTDSNKFNLLEKDFSLVATKIKDYIDNNCKSFDFVLIHYGILERIFKSMHGDAWKDEMKRFFEKLTKESDTRVVLTSGRGVPDKLPACVGFISLSSITSALIDYKSKYLISCLMYAARKSGN